MNKYFFFDIDGTLLPHGKETSLKSTKNAIKQLSTKGHKVYICTGRNLQDSQKMGDELGVDNFVLLNGQVIIENNKIIYNNFFKKEEVEYLNKVYRTCVIGYIGVNDKYILDNPNRYQMDEYFDIINIPRPLAKKHVDHSFETNQLIVAGDIDNIELNQDEYKITKWTSHGADIIPVTTSKGDAITKILTNQRNVKVYAFGDGLNDVEMFQVADVSVAMGNATKVVKEAAQFVTDDEYNDGIYNFLLKNKEIEVK